MIACKQCGAPKEPTRECYAMGVCLACLPKLPPLLTARERDIIRAGENGVLLAAAKRVTSTSLPDLTPAQCRAEVVSHMATMPHEQMLRLAALAGELGKVAT